MLIVNSRLVLPPVVEETLLHLVSYAHSDSDSESRHFSGSNGLLAVHSFTTFSSAAFSSLNVHRSKLRHRLTDGRNGNVSGAGKGRHPGPGAEE